MEDQTQEVIYHPDLTVVHRLGRGCQAEVYEVVHLRTGQHFAVKVISINGLSQKQKGRAEFEVSSNLYLSQHIRLKCFPVMYSYWTSQTSINILFELCEENAETVFKKQQNYTQRYNYLVVLMFDILVALRELEKLNIIHRDIKPENILIKDGVFKLADLGLSRILEKGNNCLTNDIGNRLGRSPEFGTGKYSVKTDIWSLGVNIFYLLESTLPFDEESLLKIKNNPNDIQKVISSPDLSIDLQASGRRSKNILSFLHLILSQMVVIDPQSRSSSSALISGFYSAVEGEQNILKNLLICYLTERQSFGEFYLMLILGYIDFYRMDGKIKEDGQSNKRKICLKVKNTILNIIKFMKLKFQIVIETNKQLKEVLAELILKWTLDISSQTPSEEQKSLQGIDDALQIYRISKVREKFPLVEWMVKVFKVIEQKCQGLSTFKICLWDLPLELYKMI